MQSLGPEELRTVERPVLFLKSEGYKAKYKTGGNPPDANRYGHNTLIETPCLLLRSMRAADLNDLLLIFTDPKVMASFDNILFDRVQMERWVQRNLDHQVQYEYGFYSVILKTNGILLNFQKLMFIPGSQKTSVKQGDFASCT